MLYLMHTQLLNQLRFPIIIAIRMLDYLAVLVVASLSVKTSLSHN